MRKHINTTHLRAGVALVDQLIKEADNQLPHFNDVNYADILQRLSKKYRRKNKAAVEEIPTLINTAK
jgi:hypothetical protein